jgi:hypothetical protein
MPAGVYVHKRKEEEHKKRIEKLREMGLDIPFERVCMRCKRLLPAYKFTLRKRKGTNIINGLIFQCRECHTIQQREYYHENRKIIKQIENDPIAKTPLKIINGKHVIDMTNGRTPKKYWTIEQQEDEVSYEQPAICIERIVNREDGYHSRIVYRHRYNKAM